MTLIHTICLTSTLFPQIKFPLHWPSNHFKVTDFCPGVPGYCSLDYPGGLCTFECLTVISVSLISVRCTVICEDDIETWLVITIIQQWALGQEVFLLEALSYISELWNLTELISGASYSFLLRARWNLAALSNLRGKTKKSKIFFLVFRMTCGKQKMGATLALDPLARLGIERKWK